MNDWNRKRKENKEAKHKTSKSQSIHKLKPLFIKFSENYAQNIESKLREESNNILKSIKAERITPIDHKTIK